MESNDDDVEEEEMIRKLPSIWDETVWDSSIEPSTAMYRTTDNIPTLCVPAFQYLAVAGRGVRSMSNSSSSSTKQSHRHRQSTVRPNPNSPKLFSTMTATSSSRRSVKQQNQQEETPDWAEEPHQDDDDDCDNANVVAAEPSQDASVASIASHVSSSSASAASSSSLQPRASSTRQEPHPKHRKHAAGGFVTLVSLYNYSEIRTIFLPFVPESLAPVVWGDLKFLLVIPAKGTSHNHHRRRHPYHPLAVRIDSLPNDGLVSCGQVPFLATSSILMTTTSSEQQQYSQDALSSRRLANEPEQHFCTIPRFKLLPVLLPRELVLVGSSQYTFPPAMASVQERHVNHDKHVHKNDGGAGGGETELWVTLHTWESVDIIPKQLVDGYLRTSSDGVIPAIVTQHPNSRVVRIPFMAGRDRPAGGCWCHLGQGWCLVRKQGIVCFVSWEGATSSRGAFVKQVGSYDATAVHPSPNLIPSPFEHTSFQKQSVASTSFRVSQSQRRLLEDQAKSLLTSISDSPFTEEESIGGKKAEEILVEALESISGLTYRGPGASPNSSISSSRRRSSFSHRERSALLLRHCSSRTQLDDTSRNRNHVSNPVPVLSIRSGVSSTDCFVLSLRRIVVENGVAAPFSDVLSWMSQQKDFFTAASVAIALLRDAETLRHLWKATDHIEADEEMSKLEGLLDGIVPLSNMSNAARKDRILCQLADMTVGCLVKGGFVMSSTLELFVSHDAHYDPARACLMLVAVTACTVSNDEGTMKSAMGRNYKPTDHHDDNILWPVRSLLRLGVARGYLAKALILLNATIPDELRRRRPSGSLATPAPPMNLCTSLVSLIVGAAPDAAELLLGLVDEQSRSRFWQSLDHKTKLALALVSISRKAPMLRQPEVRAWARLQLNECMNDEVSASGVNVYEVMPTEWLRQLCMACFRNAGCNFDTLCDPSLAEDPVGEDDDIEHHTRLLRMTRTALTAARGSGGLDFDLVIPALLILTRRGSHIQDEFQVSTQAVLDAACFLAGRPGTEESLFEFDGATVMRLCSTSGNVSAGAYLIGGRDGLVLKCCDILMQEVGMSMDDAEGFLVNDEVNLQLANSLNQFESIRFVLNDGHRRLLRLLDEYILKVRTYGEFQTDNVRGKVNPIFAARCCLRTWLCLTTPDTTSGTMWLVSWLRRRLGMDHDLISKRRLACAAIFRAFVWPASNNINNKSGLADLSSSQQLLANALDVESRFLVQLAQACCGLVEVLPSWVMCCVLSNRPLVDKQTQIS